MVAEHSQYQIPQIHKDVLIQEVERLCKLEVLEQQHTSDWALPLLIVPKKKKTIRFLSNFWEQNKRLVRKTLLIPKISTVLQELEGFSFATAIMVHANVGQKVLNVTF